MDLKREKNFFETRVTEYQNCGALNWDRALVDRLRRSARFLAALSLGLPLLDQAVCHTAWAQSGMRPG